MSGLHGPVGCACGGLRAHPAAPRPLGSRSARGSVTAETAVALPVLVAVTLGLVWMVAVAVTQVRVVDAARETARAVARDEPAAQASARGARVAPEGARITIHQDGDEVRVTVVAEVAGPGGIFGALPGPEVRAEAVAAHEPGAP